MVVGATHFCPLGGNAKHTTNPGTSGLPGRFGLNCHVARRFVAARPALPFSLVSASLAIVRRPRRIFFRLGLSSLLFCSPLVFSLLPDHGAAQCAR